MPLVILIGLALTAGGLVAGATHAFGRAHRRARPVVDLAATAGKAAPGLAGRFDPRTATGLALLVALLVTIGGGVLLAVLAALVRSSAGLARIDAGVARWGNAQASGWSTDAITALTDAGVPEAVIAYAVVLAVVETARTRDRWVIPFVVAVMGGTALLTTTIKELADRVRPDLNPIAETLGPSFPSGHSSYTAAFCAAAALLLGRRRSTAVRAALAGLAGALAVAVAASRVLLDVHWLSDVIAGLALGWAWFAACAIAFGGRLLSFGAAAAIADRAGGSSHGAARGPRGHGRRPRPLP